MIGAFIFQLDVLATCKQNLNIISTFLLSPTNRLKFIKYLMSTYYVSVTVVCILQWFAYYSGSHTVKFKISVSYRAEMNNFRLLWKISMYMGYLDQCLIANTHTFNWEDCISYIPLICKFSVIITLWTMYHLSTNILFTSDRRDNGDTEGAYLSSWEEGKIEICWSFSGLIFHPLGYESKRNSCSVGMDPCQRDTEGNWIH